MPSRVSSNRSPLSPIDCNIKHAIKERSTIEKLFKKIKKFVCSDENSPVQHRPLGSSNFVELVEASSRPKQIPRPGSAGDCSSTMFRANPELRQFFP